MKFLAAFVLTFIGRIGGGQVVGLPWPMEFDEETIDPTAQDAPDVGGHDRYPEVVSARWFINTPRSQQARASRARQ